MNKKSLPLIVLAIGLATLNLTAQDYAKPTPPPAPAPSATNGDTPHDYSKDPYSQKPKKRIISFGFFSPMVDHISFGYDQILSTDIILSTQAGIIGVGVNNSQNNYNNASGGFVELGAKFFFSPEFVTDAKLIRYNKMQGGYFKPMIVVSSFNEQYTTYTNTYTGYYTPTVTTNTGTFTGIAVIAALGKQWMLANVLSLDIYGGVGYSSNSNPGNANVRYFFSYENTGWSSIAFTGGFNIGVAF